MNKKKVNKKQTIITENKKIFKSASLTFYDKTLGYLICEEYRYKEKKLLYHTIGGKVESYDLDIFTTAIREFIEETNLEVHPNINSNNLTKEELINKLIELLIDSSYYTDICVNKEHNYFHRFYFINITNKISEEFIKNIYELPEFFNNKYKTEIDFILWIKKDSIKNYKNKFSWLTKIFFKLIYI